VDSPAGGEPGLDRGAFGNTESVMGQGNTLAKRSGVALRRCHRPVL